MITVNLDKAKAIVHDIRRAKRTAEFAPLDVKATIPSETAEAETARQAVREKYEAMQADIEAAQTLDDLKAILQ
jgi:hypothetical protein